jgi:hypothetical protein
MSLNNSALPIRQNPHPLPASMGLRTEPQLSPEEFAFRAAVTALPTERGVVRPGPATPKIVSSAHGPIRHLLLTYPSYADGAYSYRDVYADLFRKMPQFTRFTVLSHPDVIGELQQILRAADAEDRATIVEAPDYLHFLVWAEDPYVVVHDVAADPAKVFLVEPYVFPRVGDAAISDLVADATEVQSIQSPLYFQGGNVLIGDDFVLIGADYPANTIQHINDNRQIIVPPGVDVGEFVNALYQRTFDPDREVRYVGTKLIVPQAERREITVGGESWQEIVYLGTGRAQPIFHIDMFISLAGRGSDGRYRLLVGSPQAADKVLDRATVAHAMAPIFDDVARHLEREGFDVRRNPLPLTYVDDPNSRTRRWYFATSNNCLVQIDEEAGNSVWLPTYGHGPWEDLGATDDANRQIWEEMGFEVHQLADFNPFAQNLGSVHCIKKYLER